MVVSCNRLVQADTGLQAGVFSTSFRAAMRALFFLCLSFCLAPLALAQTYSEDFVSGTNYNPGQPQVDNWENFRDGLTGSYSSITAGGSEGPDITCTDPTAVSQIATALNTDATASIACDGRTWNVGTCVGTNELSVDVGICTCQANSPFTLRPDVDAGNAAWGGIGATCGPGFSGAGANVDQTLTVSVQPLGAPTDIDLSLELFPASTSPVTGVNTFIDVELRNIGPADASGVTVDFDLPSGLAYQSDDSGGDYNSATGVWTVGALAAGNTTRIRVIVEVLSSGSYTVEGEVASANENDTDSVPGNFSTNPAEDDGESVTLSPQAPSPPLVCLGRPVTPLNFQTVFAESAGANPNSPQIGDVFRFTNVAAGADALVEVTGATGGASLATIDNDADGFAENLQPTLIATAGGDASVSMEITIVASGTTAAAQLDFAASGVDIDGAGNLFEYVEMSDNFVEFALNDPTDLAVDTTAPPAGFTRFISTDDTPAGTDGTDPPAPVQNGISETPTHIVTAFYTDFTVFTYTIGKTGTSGTGGAGRLNSLAFDCPTINGLTTDNAQDEDFGDAPASYGTPIHVINSGIQLGATNTAETAAGNSANASTDAGDDGVSLPANFQGLVPVTFDVDTRGAGGFLQVFADWNGDGDFGDTGEQPVIDLTDNDGNDGTPISVWITPPLETIDGTSFMRFRWSLASGLGVEDPAGSGEVEDYLVTLVSAEAADLSVTLSSDNPTPAAGDTVRISLTVQNQGPRATDGVIIDYQLPPGLIFQSDLDFGGSYDETTGIWTVPGPLAVGASLTLQIDVTVALSGPYDSLAEVTASDLFDPDSTPANSASQPGEDDTATLSFSPTGGAMLCGVPSTGTPSTFAGQISWIDWGTQSLNAGQSANVPVTLPDGRAVTFTITVENTSPRGLSSQAISSARPLATLFGTDVTTGQRALRHRNTSLGALFSVTSSVPLDLVVGDGEAHGSANETWQVSSDGGIFETIDSINTAAFDYIGNETNTISSTGNAQPGFGTPVAVTRNASTLTAEVGIGGAGVTAIAIGVFLPDTGDAPSGYPIAAHDKDQFSPTCNAYGADNIFIGSVAPDGDNATAIASPDADGDSNTNVDDETGLTFPALTAGIAANFDIPVSGGRLQAWIDWNGDNDFDDTVNSISEQVAVDIVPSGGIASFTVTPPIGIGSGDLVARFRVASATGLSPAGFAEDGEVEDYVLAFTGSNTELSGNKSVSVFDPLGEGLFALPGNDVVYTITITNTGDVPTDTDSIVVIDELPPEVTFFNGDLDGPGAETEAVAFADLQATGLDTFNFANDVGFSDSTTRPATFADCSYAPAIGYDPAVTYVCVNPKGVMQAGDPDPSFAVSFRVRIR